MNRSSRTSFVRGALLSLAVSIAALYPSLAAAGELVEKDTGTRFPDTITVERDSLSWALEATGVGLREATFMKVNVYAVVSYVEQGTDLGDDPAAGLIAADVAKRIHMQFVRDVGADKITEAYRDGIKKNFKDKTSGFADDLDRFLAYFDKEVTDGGSITLTYLPGVGLVTAIDGEEKGVIDNPALARALWTIWFGGHPVSEGMRRDLLSRVAGGD